MHNKPKRRLDGRQYTIYEQHLYRQPSVVLPYIYLLKIFSLKLEYRLDVFSIESFICLKT